MIDIPLIVDSIPRMLMGIGLTFQLLFLSGVLGLALAVVLLLMRISGRWYLARGVASSGNLTYDVPEGTQSGSRDAPLSAAPAACP